MTEPLTTQCLNPRDGHTHKIIVIEQRRAATARVFLKYFDYFLSHLTETLTIYYLYPCDGWIFTKTPKSNQMIRCRRRNDVVERSETAS